MHRLASVLAGLAWLLPVADAHGATWHMPTPYPDGAHHTRNIAQFANEVRATTNGELDIVVHPGGALFRHGDIHRAVRGGEVPIGELLMATLGNDDPIFKADNLPFLATDFDAARRLWRASRPHVEQWLAAHGLVLLYVVPWPPQGLYVNACIDDAAALSEARMRVYSPMSARFAALLDASPVSVDVPDIPHAFGTGMIDAMFTSPSTGVSSRAWDYTGCYLDVRAWIPKNMVIANREALQALSAAQRDALSEAAARAEARGWQMAEDETREATRVLSENMRVQAPAPALRAGLESAARVLAQEWALDAGAGGRDVLAAMEQ